MCVLNRRPGPCIPEGFQTTVTVPTLARRWEGEVRPHHFAGVATVVTKLFGIVRPDLALFGQKDYQQAALVKRLVIDLNLGVAINVRPTMREQDGLAMSSRNRYLSPEDRRASTILYRALQAGRQAIEAGGEAVQRSSTSCGKRSNKNLWLASNISPCAIQRAWSHSSRSTAAPYYWARSGSVLSASSIIWW